MCFEVLGFDVFLNHNLKPFVLEVNMSPSLATDSPLDTKIKRLVLTDTMTLMNVTGKLKKHYLAKTKLAMQQRAVSGRPKETREDKQALHFKAQLKRDKYEDKHLGGFQKTYPAADRSYYDQFIEKSAEAYHTRTGVAKAREESKTTRLPTPVKPPEQLKTSGGRSEPVTAPRLPEQLKSNTTLKNPLVSVFSRLASSKSASNPITTSARLALQVDQREESTSNYQFLSRIGELGLGQKATDLLLNRDSLDRPQPTGAFSGFLKTYQLELKPAVPSRKLEPSVKVTKTNR
jgi:hypothetical protein